MDAMMNGGAPSTSKVEELPPAPTKEPEPAQSKSKDAELDIESQIQAELAELQGGRKKTGGGVGGKGKQPEQAKPKAKRFRSLDTDTECCKFRTIMGLWDPVKDESLELIFFFSSSSNFLTRLVWSLKCSSLLARLLTTHTF